MRLQAFFNAVINRLAQALYWLHETRHARLLLWLMALGGMASLLFIRPGALENAAVKTYKLSEVTTSTANTWVRINGILEPVQGYQTRFDLGAVELRGGRFIPMTDSGATSRLWVLDEDLPSYSPGVPVTVSGIIVFGHRRPTCAVFAAGSAAQRGAGELGRRALAWWRWSFQFCSRRWRGWRTLRTTRCLRQQKPHPQKRPPTFCGLAI